MKHFIPLFFVALIACKPDKPALPDDILPISKMKLIMADIHIADSVAETKQQGGEDEKKLTQAYYKRIYELHGISEEQFVKSYRFYEENPVWLNLLYEEVLNELSARTAHVGK